MKKRSLFLLLASMLALASCDGDIVPPGGKVESVSISQESIEVQLGKRSSEVTVTLEGTGNYNKNVKLVSEDESIAKTSFTGIESGSSFKVYGIAAGNTKINIISLQDETKAASLSVAVKAKEEIPEPSEVLSVSLDRDTKLFHLSDQAIEVSVAINGRGPYDKTGRVEVSENACVTVDKTSISDGEKITITPKALSVGETATLIKVIANGDEEKFDELAVRVIEDEEESYEDVISLNCAARKLIEGGETYTVYATTESDTVDWSFKEEDAGEYIEIVGTPTKEEATIKPLKATPDGTVATLVARVGEAKAECRFTVAAREKEMRTYYVSNNSYLGYGQVYFYAWKGEDSNKVENAEFPGVELTEKIQNTLGEDCYQFSVDIKEFENFIISDGTKQEGHQQMDCSFEWFGSNNNIWYDGEGAHFTQIVKDEPTVSFFTNSVSLYTEESISYGFEVRKGEVVCEITNGSDKVLIKEYSNGSITVSGLAVGNATIRAYIPNPLDPEGEPLAEDFLFVEVLDVTQVKSFYFTNVNALKWEKLYAHMWKDGDADNTATHWPGVELTNPLKNKGGEQVFLVHVPAKYDRFVINNGGNGAQTIDIEVDHPSFSEYNNIYCSGEPTDGKYGVNFANFEEFTYEVSFAVGSTTVYNGQNVRVIVNANDTGVTYNITEGSDVVQLYETSDNHIILKWLKAGSAKIMATLHGVSAELSVTCVDEEAPEVTDFLYFTNNFGWEEVYIYAWGDKGTTMTWPGEKLTSSVKNADNQDCYKLLFDTALYDKFIINNGAGAQTVDVSMTLVEWVTNNNIYLPGSTDDLGHYYVGFANYHASHNYEGTYHICECGAKDPNYWVNVTFTFNDFDVGIGNSMFIVGIGDETNNWTDWTYWKEMHYNTDHWELTLYMHKGVHIEFKLAKTGGEMEKGSNKSWTIPDEPTTYDCHWQTY